MLKPFIAEELQQVRQKMAMANPKPSQSEIEFQLDKVITRNGKYKYVQNIENYSYDYNDNFDLYGEYLKDKNQSVIPLGFNPGEEDYYLVPGIDVIAGMTGHGKSMFGNSIAYRAVKDGKNVLYISLEISKKLILYQMLSIYSLDKTNREEQAISHSDIKRHKLSVKQEQEVFRKLYKEFKELNGKLFILDEWDFDSSSSIELQRKLFGIEELAQSATGKGLDLIIIDYIQLFKTHKEKRTTTEYETISLWINDFRKMSNNFLGQNREIPIVVLSQLNRDAWNEAHEIEKKESKNEALPPGKKKGVPAFTPSIAQIAGCAEICKAASIVYVIRTTESSKISNQCMISLIKNRDGECPQGESIAYMNPKYYTVGLPTESKVEYVGTLEELITPTVDASIPL